MANLKMTELMVLLLHAIHPSVYKDSSPLTLRVGGWGVDSAFGQESLAPSPTGIQNKTNFPFPQPCFFIAFLNGSSWTPL